MCTHRTWHPCTCDKLNSVMSSSLDPDTFQIQLHTTILWTPAIWCTFSLATPAMAAKHPLNPPYSFSQPFLASIVPQVNPKNIPYPKLTCICVLVKKFHSSTSAVISQWNLSQIPYPLPSTVHSPLVVKRLVTPSSTMTWTKMESYTRTAPNTSMKLFKAGI